MSKFQISARDVAKRMDEVTKAVVNGEANVNVGNMMIGEYKALMASYRLQVEVSKMTGKPLGSTLVDMS